MRQSTFQNLADARSALLAAEAAHPDSSELKALHASLFAVVQDHANLLTDEQYQTLSGGKHDG